MTKREIIEELAKKKEVETIVKNVAKNSFDNTDDLTNDIYLELLTKPENKIIELYNKKQLNYFVANMVKNNLLSLNSRYYYNYGRWNTNRSEFVYDENNEPEIDLYN